MTNLTEVWTAVKSWSPEQRLALAAQLLQSVKCNEEAQPVSEERQGALLQLIGIWKTDRPPNDDDVEVILEQQSPATGPP